MPRSTHPPSTAATRARTLGSQDQLQHLIGVFEEIFEFVACRAEHLLRELRRHLDSRHGRIFRYVADLIHLDAGVATQRGLELLGKGRRLRISAWESAHESRELRLRHCGRKVNAGNTRRSQQMREASFARRRPQRHAVQQNLRPRSAQQHTAPAAVLQRVAQFFPRGFKLLRSLCVAKLIQPRKFQKNVQAADKRPRPASCFSTHPRWPAILPLLSSFLQYSPAAYCGFPCLSLASLYIRVPAPSTQASPLPLYSSQ